MPQYLDKNGNPTAAPAKTYLDPNSGEPINQIVGATAPPPTFGSRLFGNNPGSDVLGTVGAHLKNLVTGPYHAFTDDPRNPEEQSLVQSHGGVNSAPQSVLSPPPSVNPVLSGLNRIGLGMNRMLVQPTQEATRTAIAQHRAGNNFGNEYDANGNYTPTALSSAMDAIPIAGPWARSVENDAQQHGAMAGLAGLGTDLLAPKVAGKVAGGALRGTGLATEAASATPASLRVAGTRGLVMGAPEELLNRALKPSVGYPDFEESTGAALPTINKMNPAPGVQGFADATERAKQATHANYERMKAPVANEPLDTTPLVGQQVRSIPATERFETPGIIGNTAERASAYDMTPQTRTITSPLVDEYGHPITRMETIAPQRPLLDTVDEIRKDTNAKLKQKVFESPNKQTALSNPETSRLNAVNTGARNLVYEKIADANGIPESDVRANQDLYGHLSDIGEVAGKRATVAGRANPMSLQESLGFNHNPISGAYNFATQRVLRSLTDSDAVTNAALDRYRNPNGISLAPRPGPVPQAGAAVGNLMQGVGKGLSAMPLKYNPLLYTPKDSQ